MSERPQRKFQYLYTRYFAQGSIDTMQESSSSEEWPALPNILSDADAEPLRALEFYSGIGGMYMALQRALGDPGRCKVMAAFDINNVANDVREWLFEQVKSSQLGHCSDWTS